ncbi:YbaB/EbfC family nucleoid-associated protein [Streptosporangium sp. KLBMP 9127]|nr:YbaB/EbfC family nucleoid-associated protein [Streptosporangium sp. KLBMP 9127]
MTLHDFDPGNFQIEDLERMAREGEAAIDRLSGVFAELDTVTGEGEGAGGLARAVVDGTGRIKEISLEPRIMRMDSAGIAEAVTEAVRTAQEDAAKRNEELLATVMGGETPSLDPARIREQFAEINDSFTESLDDLTRRHRM